MPEDNLLKTEEAISETEVPVSESQSVVVEVTPEKATPVVEDGLADNSPDASSQTPQSEKIDSKDTGSFANTSSSAEATADKPSSVEATTDKPSSAEATADKHDDKGVEAEVVEDGLADNSPDASLQTPQSEKIGSKDTGSFANAQDDKGVGNEATADKPSSAEATADKSTSAEVTADSAVKPEAGIPFIQKVLLYLGELRKKANSKRKAQLEKNLEIILTEAWKTETITNNDVERVTGASDRQALNYLKELVKRGKLMRFGKGRNIHYKPLR